MPDHGFWNLAQQNPDRVALVTDDETEIRAGELLARTNRLVHGLRALGLGKGDVLATVLPNGAETIELYLAALQAGLYLVPINHHLTGPEIAYVIQDSAAKVVVGHDRFGPACTTAITELNFPAEARFCVGDVAGFRPYAELSAGQPSTLPADRRAGQVMNYTSGTTGQPKGVRRQLVDMDPDEMMSLFGMYLMLFGIQPNDDNVHLCGSPLYHTAVLVFASSSLHLGHGVVLMDKWLPERTLELIERYRVTTSHMVPTQFHRLLGLPEEVLSKYDLSSLRSMVHAAAPCPIDIKRRILDWWGPVVWEYYAASEGGGTVVTPQEWLEKPGTVGKAWPTSQIRILDDEGTVLRAGEIGTVYMKLGGGQDFEYHGDKKKTADNRRDGFFTVGDVGYLDEDGFLFLRDRKIDMIISGGANL